MSEAGRTIDAGRLWYGGLMAGVVGAGVALVGLLVVRGILDIPVPVPRDGRLVDASTAWYAAAAVLAAAVATGLLQVLLLTAPRPYEFFTWIVGLAVAIAVLVPYTTTAELSTKVAVSGINLAIGLAIGPIVASVGRSSARLLHESAGDGAPQRWA